jgi:hypothetical protein
MESFPAEMHGGKDILESITWWILQMLCVRRARYDSACPSTMGHDPTNIAPVRASSAALKSISLSGDSVREPTE